MSSRAGDDRPIRHFTIAEADALVPHLESTFARILRIRTELHSAAASLDRLGEATDPESLRRTEGAPEVRAIRGRAIALLETLGEELDGLLELGVQVKDLDTGLCDFVVRREGRDVLLCWRLGEKQIGYWHELDSGFRGRRPLDQAFERLLH